MMFRGSVPSHAQKASASSGESNTGPKAQAVVVSVRNARPSVVVTISQLSGAAQLRVCPCRRRMLSAEVACWMMWRMARMGR